MQTNNSMLSNTLNQIHRWSEPEQLPMKRMFLTRAAEVPCTILEATMIIVKTFELGVTAIKQIVNASSRAAIKVLPNTKLLREYAEHPSLLPEMKAQARLIGCHIVGLVSTIFIGIFFSPETNFKIHLKLGLVTDNQAEKNQRVLAARLQMELQKAEITKARNERFAKLEAEQQAVKNAEAEAYKVDSRLADLLMAAV